MRLLAISDLHLNHAVNRDALQTIGTYPNDWLIIAGDVGEKVDHLRFALDALAPRFAQLLWTPGNHDLWCPPDEADRTRGQARYEELVAVCQARGVLTPEDPYPLWPGDPQTPTYVCPLFVLYDYTFRPAHIAHEAALAWARQSGVVCGDEHLLSADPWPSRQAWCEARCLETEARLRALPPQARTVLISHWPLRYDLARPPRIPRFSIWCGTTRTEHWPQQYRARVVVSGHLHMRTSLIRSGVLHQEVSLGYPRDWRADRGIDWYLRDVLAPTPRFVPAHDPFMIPFQ